MFGGTCYDTVGTYQVPVSSSGWVQIGGSYTASATETGLTLYAQLVGATSAQSFYLDDVVITETAPPPGGTPIAAYNFQDGGLDGRVPFGPVTLTNTTSPIADPSGNSHSLLTSNRTAGYMGPSLNLLNVSGVVAGATYQVTAYVLLAVADSSNPTATISTKMTDCASSGTYNNAATSGALSNTAWTNTGYIQLQQLSGPTYEPGALYPVEQCHRFFLHQRRHHQPGRTAATNSKPAGQHGYCQHVRGWRSRWLEFAYWQLHIGQRHRSCAQRYT